jgi:protocatechuate 3,4-dioxygenase beta subunit
MYLFHKYIYSSFCLLFIVLEIVSSQHCAKFGRHLLQHQCVLTPEGTEGPYYLPKQLIRRDIRENKAGLPFKLRFIFTDVNTCEPMANVSVDIWQADPLGYYSSYTKNSPYVAVSPINVQHAPPTDNTTFLRGVQITDKNGIAEFMTIFPGIILFCH